MPMTRRRRGEIGVSGNLDTDGYVGDDYLAELDGHSGRAIYDRMRRSDPIVGLTIDVLGLPIRRADWTVEPASDDARDVEIGEFIGTALLDHMTHTWDDTLRHALLMLPFGFSVLEKVWAFVDGMWTIAKLAPRLPSSVTRWERGGADRRTLIGPIQEDDEGNEIVLPIEKLLVFTHGKEGDNWEGVSILRRAYKAWFIKEDAEKVNAIGIDRFGAGVPVMHVPMTVTEGSKEWDATKALLEDFSANEQGYVIEPEGYAFRIEGAGTGGSAGGTGVNPLPTIKHYDESIAKAMLQMFLNLGTSETGSRSLGAEFISFFQQAEQAHADYIAGIVNRFLIPEWVKYNWDGVEEFPQLAVSRVDELSYDALAILTNAGLITPDLDLENAIRRQQHLPEREEEEVEEPVAPEPDDDEGDEPDDEIEREDVENAARDAMPQLLKLHGVQASALARQLLEGKSIPHLAVPNKAEAFDALTVSGLDDTEVAQLLVEELAMNLKVYVARAYNLLRRRQINGSALATALGKVVRKLPHEAMVNEATRYIATCFPAMIDAPDPEWEELDEPLRPIEKEASDAVREYFDQVRARMEREIGDIPEDDG